VDVAVNVPGINRRKPALELEWDSPASTDTFTLRDVSFSYSILLEVGGAHVTQR
jgi:hypothetical protein